MKNQQNNYIRIKIKTIDSNIHDIIFDESNPTIKDLKKKIEFKLKLPTTKQRLIYQGRVLQDNQIFSDYKIENDHVIHLVEQDLQNNRTNNYPNPNNTTIADNPQNQNNNNIINILGRENNQTSPFSDIFNLIMQTSNSLNNPMNNLRNNPLNLNNINSNVNNPSSIPVLENLFQNNFNNINNLNLNVNLFEGYFIPESFKSLEKQTSFNKLESIEVIKQNINNIRELFKNTPNLNFEYSNSLKNIFLTNETSVNSTIDFKIGQWIDAKDNLDQWIEAQILEIKDNKAFIHFFGWGNTWNEWIKTDSGRLAIFRTYTLQSPFSRYYSPFPNKKEDGGLCLTNMQNFDNFDNLHDIINFSDKLREKIMKIILIRENYSARLTNLTSKNIDEELNKFDKTIFFSMCQTAPLMDRIGRLLSDFSNYIFNFCYKKYENDFEKYKNNIEIDTSRTNNYSGDSNLSQTIPVMRNPGEVAETQNLTRPRMGLIIGLNQPPLTNPRNSTTSPVRNENNTKFPENKLQISKQKNIEIYKLSTKKFFVESAAQTQNLQEKNNTYFYKNDNFSILSEKVYNILEQTEKNESEVNVKIKNEKILNFYSSASNNYINKPEKVNISRMISSKGFINRNTNTPDKKLQESPVIFKSTGYIGRKADKIIIEADKLNEIIIDLNVKNNIEIIENKIIHNINEEIKENKSKSKKISMLKKLSEKNLHLINNSKDNLNFGNSNNNNNFILNSSKVNFNKTPIIGLSDLKTKPFSKNEIQLSNNFSSSLKIKEKPKPISIQSKSIISNIIKKPH